MVINGGLHDVLNGLNSIKIFDILDSNKTPNIFSTYQLKITFEHLNLARKPFLMFQNTHTPVFEFQNIFYSSP